MTDRKTVSSDELAEFAKQNNFKVHNDVHGILTRFENYPECLDTWVKDGSLDSLKLIDQNNVGVKLYSLNNCGVVMWYNPEDKPLALFRGK